MSTTVPFAIQQDVLGVPVDGLSMEEVLDRVDQTIQERGRLRIGVVNAAKLVNMRRDATLRADVLSSDLILADGASIVWASRCLGRGLPERVTGIDLMHGLLRRGGAARYRVFCLGAEPPVLAAALRRITAEYPGIDVRGHHGYFTPAEEPAVVAAIREAKPHILFVGMTSPKKERFIARWGSQLDVPVCHGVGGSFDVLAGKVRRAPQMWQRLGLEWLYRVKQEPRRLWRRYLVTNARFCLLLLRALVRQQICRPVSQRVSRPQ
jgi:N-acetylglucosaminyldiphosphoundecaprenol N-acetyl-beta-D-mannosaminyltransferase